MARKTTKRRASARAASAARGASAHVYTPAQPPCEPRYSAAHINAAIALRLLRQIAPLAAPSAYASPDWWQGALHARDAGAAALEAASASFGAAIALERAKVEAHNTRLVEAASLVTLTVRDIAETGILSIDPAEIMAEARRRKNKGKRGHKSANRWLAYGCPICTKEQERPNGTIQRTNTVRCSADNRLIVCCGTHDAPHDQAIMYLIEESQPQYRLDDKYQIEDAGQEQGAEAGHTQTQSQVQLAARRRKALSNPHSADGLADVLAPTKDHSEIPF